MLHFRSAALVAGIALLAACGGSDSPVSPGTNPPPPPPPVTAAVHSVAITPTTAQVALGRTTTLTATTRDSAGAVLTGRVLAWSSSDNTIATVDANGIVTGVAVGAVSITATSEGRSAQAAITVKLSPVASVVVAPNAPMVRLGERLALLATVRDDRDTVLTGRAVRWTSSAPTVATVDSLTGSVTAMAGGQSTITATSDGVSGTTIVTVTVPVASVSVAAGPDTLEAYDQLALTAAPRDAKGNLLAGRIVRWTVDNTTIATVDSITGVLTGLDRGTVTVSATSEGKVGSIAKVVVIRYRSITAGTMHACDIASGGSVWCWGLNGREGRIGSQQVGDNMGSAVPVHVGGTGPYALRFTQISTYGTSTCGLVTDGRAYCWGGNAWGQLGTPAASELSIVPVEVAGRIAFRQISVGGDHACALSPDGQAYCWGHNDWHQFATTTSGSSPMPVAVAPAMRFSSISAGSSFTCGVSVTGPTFCWGASGLGQLGDGAKISYGNTFSATPVQVASNATFRAIDAGNAYVCGLTAGAQAQCWGSNGGKLGNGATIETSTPTIVTGGLSFASIATGNGHTCGVATDATLWCWGANGNGQLGAVAQNGTTAPVRSLGALRVAEVSVAGIATGSGSHSCTIAADRLTTYCFGRNDTGQLGNGATSSASTVNATPTIVVGQKPLP